MAQAALSLVLLTGAGLFVRSLQHANAIDMGFDGEHVGVVTWDSHALDWDDARWIALYERAAEEVRSLPGIGSAALGAMVPGRSSMNLSGLEREPGDTIPELSGGGPYMTAVDTAYFRTLGIRLLKGRTFTAADGANAPDAIVVDEAFAAEVWPGQDALGKCVRFPTEPCMQVVGVVENAMRPSYTAEPVPQFYRPLAQVDDLPRRALFVRVRSGDAEEVLPALRQRVQSLDAQLPYADVRTLASHFAAQLRPWRMGATLLIAFGALALIVAAVGLYSIMAYTVSLRRRELGVRLALGARADQVRTLVLRDAGSVLAVGVGLGVALSLVLAGTVRSLLFQVDPRDPVVLATVSLVLLAVGAVATVLPARRAASVQPAAVLREE